MTNKNRVVGELLNPEVQLQELCNVLNNDSQPLVKQAFRELACRWLQVENLGKMLGMDSGLNYDLQHALNPRFTPKDKGAIWTTNFPERLPITPEQAASRWFALLVLNPLHEKLRGPCPRCGNYYLRKRATKVYCSQRCGNIVSAKRSTAAVAKAERDALMKSAAWWWPQWTAAKHPYCSFWVAKQVNRERKTMKINDTWKFVQRSITAKWISRNRLAIEREVKASQQQVTAEPFLTPRRLTRIRNASSSLPCTSLV